MTRAIIGDFRTGRRILDLPYVSLSWEAMRNTAESIRAKVTVNDPEVRSLGLTSAATPGKAFLALIENDQFVAGGPIWSHTYDKDSGILDITAAGMWSYFDHRVLLPVLAAGQNPLGADTTLGGLDLGTIAKRLVQQAQSWTGGNVPVVFEADRAGARERNYLGADLNVVGTALEQLTGVLNGPDIEFRPRWTADRLGVEWLLRTGTEEQPRLRSASVHVWDYSVPSPSISGLRVVTDATRMTGQVFGSGGRTADAVLQTRVTDSTLTDLGYPLLESVDSSHSSVQEVDTLNEYGLEEARNGATPNEFWDFNVRAQEAPRVGEYWIGDQLVVKMQNDPVIPDGDYAWTIAGLSGDGEGEWIKVKTTVASG